MKGAPSTYTSEIADKICLEIASGRSVKDICDNEDWSPAQSSVYKWLLRHDDFAEKYARAREAQQEADVNQMREIAMQATPENVAVAKLQIDTIKWTASRLARKKYGDHQTFNHNGANNEGVKVRHEFDFSKLSSSVLREIALLDSDDDAGGNSASMG